MSRVWIAVAGVAIAAVIGLFVLLDGDDGGETAAKTPAPQVAGDEPSPPDPGTPEPARPELPDSDDSKPQNSGPGYIEYVNDAGVRIRDKRGRDVETNYEAPVRRPFKSLDIDARVLDKMGRELRGVARRCKEAHGGDISAGGRIQPRVAFEIKQGQLTVTEAQISLTNVKKDGEFQRCFYSGAVGLAVAAADHRDVEHHKMLVPIDLDRL